MPSKTARANIFQRKIYLCNCALTYCFSSFVNDLTALSASRSSSSSL
jgi:hypothetical protein